MKIKQISLILLAMLVVIPVSSAIFSIQNFETTSQVTDAESDTSSHPIIHDRSPRAFMRDDRLVLQGFSNQVITPELIKNMAIGLDEVAIGAANSSTTISGVGFNVPVTIDLASYIILENSVFSNFVSDHALKITNSDHITIRNNNFLNITASGINLNVITTVDSNHLYFENNYFADINATANLDVTILNMLRTPHSNITGNTVYNGAVTDGQFNFNGFIVAESNNMTVHNNYIYGVNAIQANFMSFSTLNDVFYDYNYFYSSSILNGTGYNFDTVNNIVSDFSNYLLSLNIGLGNGYTGFRYNAVTNVVENHTHIESIDIETGDLIALNITGSDNINIFNYYVYQLTTHSGRIISVNVDTSTNIKLIDPKTNFLSSTATGIDLDNSQSIYGGYIKDSSGIVLNSSEFNNFQSNSQLFGLYIQNSKVTSIENNFNYYTGSVIHGNVIEQGLAGSEYNYSYFSSWSASQVYGIEMNNTLASLYFYGTYFVSIEYTTFAHEIIVENSADLIFDSMYFFYIYSYAPFFETSAVYVLDSHNITLINSVFYGLLSYYSQMSTINTYNASDVLIYNNAMYYNYAYETAYIGMYLRNSINLNVTLNTLYYIKSFYTATSLGIDVITDKIGYGIVLENTNSSNISNTTSTGVAQWYNADDKSTNVVLFANTIGGVEDFITTFEKPSDLIYDADVDAGATLTWTASTELPEQASNYTITFDGKEVQQGNWTSGEAITYDISGLNFGVYVLILELIQTNGFVSTDVVIITATELTAPAIVQAPADFTTVQHGEASIDWQVFEKNPTSYSIYQGDVGIDYGFYESNSTISFPLKAIPLGSYNFTLTLRDEAGNEASDTVQVTIVQASPISFILENDEVTFEVGTANNTLNFTVSGTIKGDFVVSVDDINTDSGTWEDGVEVFYNITGLPVGQYKYHFFVIDEVGNIGEFDILVNIIPQQINDAGTDDSGVLNQIGNLVQQVQNVNITPDNVIPLAAAAFAGGIIFFPGMKFIRGRVGQATENVAKGSTKSKPKKKEK